jgi:hypothetical protein
VGHIVSADGVKIDPSRVECIHKLTLPRSKKEIQSFLGKFIFLRRFIYNFVELVKFIIAMLRKDSEVKWTIDAKIYFELIKKYFVDAPVLISPNFSKDFLIFSFSSVDTLVVVFL